MVAVSLGLEVCMNLKSKLNLAMIVFGEV